MRLLLCICVPFIMVTTLVASGDSWSPGDSISISELTYSLEGELNTINTYYEQELYTINNQLSEIKEELVDVLSGKVTNEVAVQVLTRKILLEDQRKQLLSDQSIDLAKIRYKKGIEVIKILYEKVLGLDHHFSSLKTHHTIQQMSNPNAYPGFKSSGEVLKDRLYKKSSVSVPTLLQGNGYVSAIYSLVSGFFGDGKSNERQTELNDVSCILDFTLKMSNDLNTIYFETEFLISNNNTLREECMTLFDEYISVINYKTPLDRCRDTDDWEAVDELLDAFIEGIRTAQESGDERLINSVVNKGHINLEFSIDRLLSFLEKYSAFVAQGENYYKKFALVVHSYDNEKDCAGQLPVQFATLQAEINYSIEKFIQAYDIAELKGSKLKDLLYGYN